MKFYENLVHIWFYCGIIYSLYFLFIKSKSREYQNTVEEIKWNLGFNEDQIFFTALTVCFIGGIFLYS